jgi:hypothetical protein
MIAVTSGTVCNITLGAERESAGRGILMAAHPVRTNPAIPTSEWHPSSHDYAHSQLTSALRAALIALVLLGILAVIVLL